MPPRFDETQEIRPAAPDDVIRGLLALPFARIDPLAVGDSAAGVIGDGEYAVIAAARGKLTVTAHERYSLLTAGQALALGAVGSYALQAVSDCVAIRVTLTGELADRLLGPLLREGAAVFPVGAAAVREAVLGLSALEEGGAPVKGETASVCAYTLLTRLQSGQARELGEVPSVSPLVESAIAVIQEEFPYLEGLDDLAERLEVSKAHLIRSFTRQTGISPAKYITRVKVEYAKLLLRDEDASIAYVAEASGFANANYFAKVFRRQTGMTPTEYLESVPRRDRRGPPPPRHFPLW